MLDVAENEDTELESRFQKADIKNVLCSSLNQYMLCKIVFVQPVKMLLD